MIKAAQNQAVGRRKGRKSGTPLRTKAQPSPSVAPTKAMCGRVSVPTKTTREWGPVVTKPIRPWSCTLTRTLRINKPCRAWDVCAVSHRIATDLRGIGAGPDTAQRRQCRRTGSDSSHERDLAATPSCRFPAASAAESRLMQTNLSPRIRITLNYSQP
jgi:hypothetical protein